MAMTNTYATHVGVFRTRAAAEKTVADLRADGYQDDHIGLVTETRDVPVADTGPGVGTWAGFGVALGALAGSAVVAGLVPGVIPVLALGAAGTVLLYAAVGAVVAAVARAGAFKPSESGAPERFVVTVDAGTEHDRPAEVFSRWGPASPAGQHDFCW